MFYKYAWSWLLNKKNRVYISKALEEMIKDVLKIWCKSLNLLYTVILEFKNQEFTVLMRKYNNKSYHTENKRSQL